MGLISQYAETKWYPTNKKWYEGIANEKGNQKYFFTHKGNCFIVEVKELPRTSLIPVTVYCDYCGYIYETPYAEYRIRINKIPMVCCNNVICMKLKREEINLLKYGVKNQFERSEVKDKIIVYNLEHYGVEHHFQNKDFLNKRIETNIEKFGAENNSQTKEWYEQIQETQLLHYGVPFYFQTDEFKKRRKITCIKKYGFENPNRNIKIKIKTAETLFKHGTCNTSKQQVHIHSLIGGILNYSNNTPNLDIGFPDKLIYCEYNGGGHNLNVVFGNMTQKEFANKERRREFYLKSKGWKEIKIISLKDKLPQDNIIIELFNMGKEYLLNSDHAYFEIDIDKNRIWCKEYEITYDFVDLYKFPTSYKN